MATITFPLLTVVDDSGAIVSGATVAVASITDKAGTAISSPGYTLNAGADPFYTLDYDAEAHGEAVLTLAISKVSSTITGLNAAPRFYLARDSGRLLVALPTAAAGANGGLPTGDASGRVLLQPTQTGVTIPTVTAVGTLTTYTGNTPQTGDAFARIGVNGAGLTAIPSGDSTATAGSSSTITLPSGDPQSAANLAGWRVLIVAGTGAGQVGTVASSASRVQTMAANWTTTPDSTSMYELLPPGGSVSLGANAPTGWINAAALATDALSAAAVSAAAVSKIQAGLASSAPTAAQIRAEMDSNSTKLAYLTGPVATAAQIPANFTTATFASAGVFSTGALANGPAGGGGGGGSVTLASNGLDAVVVDGGLNARQALAEILAASAGVISGAGTGLIVVKGGNTSTTRITATTDNAGNRSSVTLTPPN